MIKVPVNVTLKLNPFQLTNFESWLRNKFEVVNFMIVPDTEKLYENDETFRKLVKAVKSANKIKNDYINKNN